MNQVCSINCFTNELCTKRIRFLIVCVDFYKVKYVLIRLYLLYLSFSCLAFWCLIWKSRKKQQHFLINQKLALRPYCLFSINIAYAFVFLVCKRRYCKLSYVLLSDVLLFYLGRYHLSVISVILLLFDKRRQCP